MHLPLLVAIAPFGEDAPACGGAADDSPAQGHTHFFQSVFSQTLVGDHSAAAGERSTPGIPPVRTAPQENAAQGTVPLMRTLVPAMQAVRGAEAECIETAAWFASSEAPALPPQPAQNIGLPADPAVEGEGSAAVAAVMIVWNAGVATRAQGFARPDVALSERGMTALVCAMKDARPAHNSPLPVHANAVPVPLQVESPARDLPIEGDDPAKVSAFPGRSATRPPAPPSVHAEHQSLLAGQAQPLAVARDGPPASVPGGNEPADTRRAQAPGRIERATPASKLPEAVSPPDKSPSHQTASPGAERRSEPAPDMRAKSPWRDLPQPAEPGPSPVAASTNGHNQVGTRPGPGTAEPPLPAAQQFNALSPDDERPSHRSPASDAGQQSERAPARRGETSTRPPYPVPSQCVEPGAPVVPAAERGAILVGAIADGAEWAGASGADPNDANAEKFTAELPLSETRGAALHTAASAPARPDHARGIAVQVAEIVSTARERMIELKLHPEELGRVSMTLSQDGGALTVALTAERAETLELMRRHIDLLGEELRRLGYGSVDFTFADGHAGGHRPDRSASFRDAPADSAGHSSVPDVATDAGTNPAHTTATAAGGMDIRL